MRHASHAEYVKIERCSNVGVFVRARNCHPPQSSLLHLISSPKTCQGFWLPRSTMAQQSAIVGPANLE